MRHPLSFLTSGADDLYYNALQSVFVAPLSWHSRIVEIKKSQQIISKIFVYLYNMADRMNPQQRRKCMQSIRSKDTKPELLVRKFLFSRGFRYRLNVKKLPGSPDIVLKKYRTAIFINGCFWHGHQDCKYFVLPKTNTPFWQEKIRRNQDRDLKRRIELRDMGWHTITLWECQLKPKVLQQSLNGLEKTLCQIYLGDRR